MARKSKQTGFDATALQVRRAYVRYYGKPMNTGLPYNEVLNPLIEEIGIDRVKALVLAESNDTSKDFDPPNFEA
jgi:hypothetical protein